MIKSIIEVKDTSEYKNLMKSIAIKIVEFQSEKVGIGDTATDEMICYYLKCELSKIFDKEDTERMVKTFYSLIHW